MSDYDLTDIPAFRRGLKQALENNLSCFVDILKNVNPFLFKLPFGCAHVIAGNFKQPIIDAAIDPYGVSHLNKFYIEGSLSSFRFNVDCGLLDVAAAHNYDSLVTDLLCKFADSAAQILARAVAGTYDGTLSTILHEKDLTDPVTRVTDAFCVDFPERFIQGEKVIVLGKDSLRTAVVQGINITDKVVYLNPPIRTDVGDIIQTSASKNTLIGLGSIFADVLGGRITDSDMIYRVPRHHHPQILCTLEHKLEDGKLSKSTLQLICERCNSDFLYCHPRVLELLLQSLGDEVVCTEIGYSEVYKWGSVMIAANQFLPTDSLFVLNSSFFSIQQLSDICFEEKDDNHFFSDDESLVFSLVWYANLVCSDLSQQQVITNIQKII